MDLGGIYLEGRNDLLLYCFPLSLIKPHELKSFFTQGFDLMQLFTRKDVAPECVANQIKAMLQGAHNH